MKRLRLSSFMLLTVFIGLAFAFVMQRERAIRREANIARLQNDVEVLTQIEARTQKSMQRQAEKLRLAEEQQRITGGEATKAGTNQ
jgi:Flp pilus assembly protein TadB